MSRLNELVNSYLSKSDWRVNENSNMSYSLQGLNQYLYSSIISRYWLEEIYPEEVSSAHLQGDLHIHDLGSLSAYCTGWSLEDLLLKGFTGVEGKIASKPAKHFRSALGQVVNFMFTLQGEVAGAIAFSNFDTLLAPYIAQDGLSFCEVKQSIQEFVFNLNVPTRTGFQTPFTNLSFDLVVPKYLANENVIVGGYRQPHTYSDFQREMDMLNKAFWQVMIEGDAHGRIFTFPIPTYSIDKNFPWDSDEFDLLWKLTAKYGAPYFSNFINSDMEPSDVRSMCCRLRLDNTSIRTRLTQFVTDRGELKKKGGGLFGANPLTGSIGVVTINMPRIGYLSSTEEEFFERLSELMEIAKKSLEIKRDVIEDLTIRGLYPYSRFYLSEVYQLTGGYWTNHFSTIGLIGMHEACINFLGVGIDSEEGRQFAIKVLNFMREKILQFQRQTGNLYNLEATPAEGVSYRLAKIDRRKFPDIYTSGINEPFYTNSTQLPIDKDYDLSYILEHQDELQSLYTGGTVLHLYLGEPIEDHLVPKLLKLIFNQYKLPYLTLTPTFSICKEHGYLRGEMNNCPICGGETEVYSRVVGYFRPVRHWNAGKREEFKLRRYLKI